MIKLGTTFKDGRLKFIVESKATQFDMTFYRCKHISSGSHITYTKTALENILNK